MFPPLLRIVTPFEKLLMQGVDVGRYKLPKSLSPQDVATLAGNAMHVDCISLAIVLSMSMVNWRRFEQVKHHETVSDTVPDAKGGLYLCGWSKGNCLVLKSDLGKKAPVSTKRKSRPRSKAAKTKAVVKQTLKNAPQKMSSSSSASKSSRMKAVFGRKWAGSFCSGRCQFGFDWPCKFAFDWLLTTNN